MFNWFRRRKEEAPAVPADAPPDAPPSDRVYQKGEQLTADEKKDLRAQALANAKAAREAIGEETLQKILAAMHAHDNSPMMQAKKILLQMDKNRLNDGLLEMIRQRERPH